MKKAIFLFFLLSVSANGVAYTLKNNKEDSSEQNSLRGGGVTTDDENAHRSLYDVMGLAPGASGCSLHSSNDGTYVCGVRSNHFVTDAGRSENHLACVALPNGSQKCAHFNLADGPGFPGAPPPAIGSGFPGGPGIPGAMWSPSEENSLDLSDFSNYHNEHDSTPGDMTFPELLTDMDAGDWTGPSGDWTGPSEDFSVNCGGHDAPNCEVCPYDEIGTYMGSAWCNGQCHWYNDECQSNN